MKRLGHPLVSLVALSWTIFELFSLTDEPRSLTGRFVGSLIQKPRTTGTLYNSTPILITRANGECVALDFESISTDEMLRSFGKEREPLVVFVAAQTSEHLLRPVLRTETYRVVTRSAIDSGEVTLDEMEFSAIKHKAVGALKASGATLDAELMENPPTVRRWDLSGLIRNTLTFGATAMLIVQPLCFPTWLRAYRERRVQRKRARGECPVCGYRLGEQRICPECGCSSP